MLDCSNWTLRNKRQWLFIQNSKVCIQDNALENVVCEMAVIFIQGGGDKSRTWIKDHINLLQIGRLNHRIIEMIIFVYYLSFMVLQSAVQSSICDIKRPGLYQYMRNSSGPLDGDTPRATVHPFSGVPSRWRHQMETFSAFVAICPGYSPVTGEFLAQRPLTRSFDVFFDLRLNKLLSKQSWGWWFETPSRPLWRHCNAV